MTNEIANPTYVSNRKCADCGTLVAVEDRAGLLVRIVMWRTYGNHGKCQKVRTERAQCRACAERDPVWNKENGRNKW